MERAQGKRPPISLDALARREDVAATSETPGPVAAGLSTARVEITVPEDGMPLNRLASEHAEGATVATIHLPAGSFPGVAVTEAKVLEPGTLPAPGQPPPPYRPAWRDLEHVPRPSEVGQVTLRRRSGRLVIPTDSGHVYGEYPPRAPFYPRGYPWTCIGRVFVWPDATAANWSWYGSGVLVGARTVLTAGHVVPWSSGDNKTKILFVAAYYDGKPAVGAGGQSWVTLAHGYDPHNSVVAHDMAVLRLNDPLGSWLGYFGIKAYDDSWEGGSYWTLVGYPVAVTSERPSWQAGIRVLDDDEDGDAQELEHHGDDTGGDSGGPFFGMWEDGPYAIGTVSGYETVSGFLGIGSEDNNIVAGGPALNALVQYARDSWPG